jgi:Tc5 transposase DNA-binding domain
MTTPTASTSNRRRNQKLLLSKIKDKYLKTSNFPNFSFISQDEDKPILHWPEDLASQEIRHQELIKKDDLDVEGDLSQPQERIMEILYEKPKEDEEQNERLRQVLDNEIAKQKLFEGSIAFNFMAISEEADNFVLIRRGSHDDTDNDERLQKSNRIPSRDEPLDLEQALDLNKIQEMSGMEEQPKKKKVLITKRKNYTKGKDKDNMEKGLAEWRDLNTKAEDEENEKTSIRQIALKHDVDYKSLHSRIKGKIEENAHQGKVSILTKEQEEELVSHIEIMAYLGYGYDVIECREAARKFPVLKPFVASKGWWEKFKARHPSLTRKKTQGITLSRMQGLTPQTAQDWLITLSVAINLGKSSKYFCLIWFS